MFVMIYFLKTQREKKLEKNNIPTPWFSKGVAKRRNFIDPLLSSLFPFSVLHYYTFFPPWGWRVLFLLGKLFSIIKNLANVDNTNYT